MFEVATPRTKLVALALLAVGLASSVVEAQDTTQPDKAACVASYENGQNQRQEGALRRAKKEFSRCADPACPDVTKGDCTTWSAELDKSIPTVTFVVKDEGGADLNDVAVLMDDQPLVPKISGAAIEVDPGSHRFRFESKGFSAIEQAVVVREGEKNRPVSIVMQKPAGKGGGGGSISPATWVLGGVGVAGIGVFAVFGGIGLSEQSDAESTCAPRCGDDVIDPIQTKFIAADIALSIGLASLGAALLVGLVTGLDSGPEPEVSARFEVFPAPGGAVAAFGLRY